MSGRVSMWVLRVTWAALAFTAGPALGAALQHHSYPVQMTCSVGAWAAWAGILIATLVLHPIGLTLLRCAAPAALGAAIAAAVTGRPSAADDVLAVAWTGVLAVGALLPATGILFVNGPAYPNERRFPLAPPGSLLLGPIEIAWAAVAGLPVLASLLLAAKAWIPGGVALIAAIAAVGILGRALHGLSRRWLVFVPAGIVLHDPMSLADPVLFPRAVIESLAPAPLGTDSLDLTQRAPGLALELTLREKVPMVRVQGRDRRGEQGASARLLFTPSRAGAVLAEAGTRRIRVGSSTS